MCRLRDVETRQGNTGIREPDERTLIAFLSSGFFEVRQNKTSVFGFELAGNGIKDVSNFRLVPVSIASNINAVECQNVVLNSKDFSDVLRS